MANSESKKSYNAAYAATKLKRVPLDMQLTAYDQLKEIAAATGNTVNGYIKDGLYIDEILNIMPDVISLSKDFKDLSGIFIVNKDNWIFGLLDDIFKV